MCGTNLSPAQPQGVTKPHGCAKRGGRPVTWIGGGGLDPKKLAGLGVPSLRELFCQVFGENTASNNAGWLRRKLAESPDSVHGQRRSLVVRARDLGAAIWNSPVIREGGQAESDEDAGGIECVKAETQGDSGGQQTHDEAMTDVPCGLNMGESAVADASAVVLSGSHHHRGVKRSCTQASAMFGNSARCSSPSGSGSTSPAATHQDDSVSPRHHPEHNHRHHKQQQQNASTSGTSKRDSSAGSTACNVAAAVGTGCTGIVITADNLSDMFVGLKVMVWWPADKKWWGATIHRLDTAAHQLQLLYSDLTEESIVGKDLKELLRKGHLVLEPGQTIPATTAGMCQDPPSASPASTSGFATTSMNFGMNSMPMSGLNGGAGCMRICTSQGLSGSGLDPRRVKSCVLPNSICSDSKATQQQELSFGRSSSVSIGTQINPSGSGSGVKTETAAAAATKSCVDVSGSYNSGSAASNQADVAAFLGFVANNAYPPVQQQQQQQGSDASQLGVWFASQQRQQQQLQLQMEANFQMQQQVQLQMQQQMAMHMSMQQTADQLMHMQVPAMSAPYAAAAAVTTLAAPNTVPAACQLADSRSPFAAMPAFNGSNTASPVAAAAAGAAVQRNGNSNSAWEDWQTATQATACVPSFALQQQQQTAGSGCVNVCRSSSSMMPHTAAQQLQLPESALNAPAMQLCNSSMLGSQDVTPKRCDCVVPELDHRLGSARPGSASEWQCSTQQQVPTGEKCVGVVTDATARQASNDAQVACHDVAAAAAVKMESTDQTRAEAEAADVDALDNLLSGADGDLFDLTDLETAAASVEQSFAQATAAALSGDLDGDDLSSSGAGSSLCESVADELAVAGLDADDAPGYYMFGGAGSPRKKQRCNAAVDVMSLEDCCRGVGTEGGGGFENDEPGFRMAEEPCGNSFAHMFDFD